MKKQSPAREKLVLGVTGGFGSGKSTVAGIFRGYGAKIIDADKIAHRLIRPGQNAYKKICGVFGTEVLQQDKAISRRRLSGIAFKNRRSLKKLNSIVHPLVIKDIKKQIKEAKSRILVLDAPLLIEAGLEELADKLIVVNINRQKQIQRLLKKTSLGREDIMLRIASQIPLRLKARLADFIIDNNGSINQTRRQARKIFCQIKNEFKS